MDIETLDYTYNTVIINSRWAIYTNGAWEVYDTIAGGDIPQVVFNLRDILKALRD